MKNNLLFFLSIILFLMSIIGAAYLNYNYYEIREIPIILEVKKGVIGFNTNTDQINFGKIMPGDAGKRVMEISFEKKTRLTIKGEGEAAKWLSISPNNLLLEPGGKKKVSFRIEVPEGAAEGKYGGKAKFYFKRAWFWEKKEN